MVADGRWQVMRQYRLERSRSRYGRRELLVAILDIELLKNLQVPD